MSWLFKPTAAAGQPNQSALGMKDDFSAIGETIGKQLRGVATFLAPPPSSPTSAADLLRNSSPTAKALVGMKNDLAELGGSLKSGFSKLTSSFIAIKDNHKKDDKDVEPYEEDKDEEDEEYVAGISEEIIDFVGELSRRPECWSDFPLPLPEDFRLSDAQLEHVSAMAESVPSIANLEATLQPTMPANHFWFIYFIFLLPRLTEHEYDLLSSTQLVETRNVLLLKLKSKKEQTDDTSDDLKQRPPSSSVPEITEIVTDVSELDESYGDPKTLQLVEDTSFSELEDYDNATRVSTHTKANIPRAVSSSGSCDWVQFQDCSISDTGSHRTGHSFSRDKDSDIESFDWLKVDESD